jgi:DNA-binding transcriptional regulator YiaG
MSNTSFARWRKRMDLTQEQAARVLGVTLRTVQHWESGKTSAGADSSPPYPVRLAMAALAKSPEMEPWPEGLEAKVVDLARRRK